MRIVHENTDDGDGGAARPAQGVLFVGHDASRSGAPIELLHFLRWFKQESKRPFAILLGRGGQLVSDFEELADTWLLDRSRWRPDALRTNLLTWAGVGEWAHRAETRDTRRFAAPCCPALVYANTIASARVVDVLAPDVPVLTHVHELEFVFSAFDSPALLRLIAKTRKFIACSNIVSEHLIRKCGVSPDRIETVHESIPVSEVRAERSREQVLQELHLPSDAMLVSGVGTPSWRKGADLFIQLARAICRRRDDVYFIWVGGANTYWDMPQVEHDLRVTRLDGRVRFIGDVVNPADYLATADVFVLSSREDPYPLVCLEAAALEKPIVCFADAGGMPEFVEADCGFVVPYLDVMAMAERVLCLLDSPDRRFRMGAAARRKVAQRHDISLVAPRLADIIERTIAGD